MSGTGKSTALGELERLGFEVVDTDDPGWEELRGDEWLWREDRMAELLAGGGDRTLYVSGCVANQGRFYDRFHAVVLLRAPADVILERIATRTTNGFGEDPVERDQILRALAAVEPLLRRGADHELDATRPVQEIVADLVTIASKI